MTSLRRPAILALAVLAAPALAIPAFAQDTPEDAFAAAAPGLMEAQGDRAEQFVEIALEGCAIRQVLRTTLEAESGPVEAEQRLSLDLRDVAPQGVIALGNPGDPFVTVNFLLTPAARAEMQAAATARSEAVDDAVAAFNTGVLEGDLGARVARSHAIQVMDDAAPQVFPLTAPPRLIFAFDRAQPALDAMFALHTGDCAPDPADLDAG